MKLVQFTRNFNSSCKAMIMIALPFACQMALVKTASAENPWTASSRPLIEEGNQLSTKRNTWQDKSLSQDVSEYDESKYPPLEEDKTLGTGVYGVPIEDSALDTMPSYSSSDKLQRFDPQSLGDIPNYPGNSYQGYSDRNIPNYRTPGQMNNNQSGFWPGNRGMNSMPFGGGSGSGFPFPGGSSGFPFTGGNGGSGSPMGGNNGWMPFSNSGFW